MLPCKLVHADAQGKTPCRAWGRFGDLDHRFEHLTCFCPGMLALGVHAKAVTDGAKAAQYLALAEDLTHTCWQMYAQMPTGTPGAFAPAPSASVEYRQVLCWWAENAVACR